jgi:hypothetical protein
LKFFQSERLITDLSVGGLEGLSLDLESKNFIQERVQRIYISGEKNRLLLGFNPSQTT